MAGRAKTIDWQEYSKRLERDMAERQMKREMRDMPFTETESLMLLLAEVFDHASHEMFEKLEWERKRRFIKERRPKSDAETSI